jgi:hypothetical protein
VKTDSLRTLDSLLRQTVTSLPVSAEEVESEQEGRRKGKKRDVKKSDVDLILLFRARKPNCTAQLPLYAHPRSVPAIMREVVGGKNCLRAHLVHYVRCIFSSSMPSSTLRTKQYYAVLLVHDREVPPASYSVSLAPDAVPLLRLLFTRQCAPENAVPRPRPGTQVKLPSELA